MATFSFDITSEYDKAEVNNVFAQVEKDITGRYDFKGTPAGISWLDDKKGYKITGAGDWQIEAILDIVRRRLIARGQSTKVLDLSGEVKENNLQASKEVPFVAGLSQDNAKQITKTIREQAPKAKPTIQGDMVRVSSGSKDELQAIMRQLEAADFSFPLQFTNFR